MRLNTLFSGLSKNKKPKLLGRGIGCGKGKTSGRGHKGQKARSGVSINGFEGGQQSIFTRLPKRGFKSKFKKCYSIINVGDIQRLIESKKISDSDYLLYGSINKDILYKVGLIKSPKCRVKLLNNGKLESKLTFDVDTVSKSAEFSVASVGGTVNQAEKIEL